MDRNLAAAPVIEPTGPGQYITRSGNIANIFSIGPDGYWFGSVENKFTFTWWKETGEHNMFLSDDIIGVKI